MLPLGRRAQFCRSSRCGFITLSALEGIEIVIPFAPVEREIGPLVRSSAQAGFSAALVFDGTHAEVADADGSTKAAKAPLIAALAFVLAFARFPG